MITTYKEPITVKLLTKHKKLLEGYLKNSNSEKESLLTELLRVEKSLRETEETLTECNTELAKCYTINSITHTAGIPGITGFTATNGGMEGISGYLNHGDPNYYNTCPKQ